MVSAVALCVNKVSLHLVKWFDNARQLVFSLGVGVRETIVSMQSRPVLVGHQIAMLGCLTLLACVRHLMSAVMPGQNHSARTLCCSVNAGVSLSVGLVPPLSADFFWLFLWVILVSVAVAQALLLIL